MKKVLLLLAVLATCLNAVAQTTDFRYGNFIYRMYERPEPSALLLKPVGNVPSEITIPSSISMGGKEYPVTGIADFALGYKNLDHEVSISSLTLPPTITYFGLYAFEKVKSCNVYISSMESWLKATFRALGNPVHGSLYVNGIEVTSFAASPGMTAVPEYVFSNCTGIVEVNLSGITAIGDGAFRGCSGITSLDIPESITEIGYSAFSHCDGLTKVNIPGSVKELDSYVFSDCKNLSEVTFNDGLQTIGESAFSKCVALKSVSVPSTVVNIREYAFEKSGMTEFIYMPDQESVFGEWVFSECTSLKKATLSGQLKKLPSKLFYNCTALESVYIGESIDSIHGNAFEGCTALSRVEIPSLESWFNKTIEPYKIQYHWNPAAYYDFYCFRDCPYSLYVNGEKVTNMTVPEGITKIRSGQFTNNVGLQSIDLANVHTIDSDAFIWCNGLKKVTLTDKLIVADRAFCSLSGIRDVYYNTTTPYYFNNLFSENTINTGTLHVRPETMELFCKIEPWMYFANIVADITDSSLDEVEAVDGDALCNVYSVAGVEVRAGVRWADWQAGLTPGIYIVRLADGTVRKAAVR